jgi:superfamily II DNA or RNA helicase
VQTDLKYEEFLAGKQLVDAPNGIKVDGDIHKDLFPFQRDIVRWALQRGRSAIFADCGTGKTLMQLVWAENVPGRVLILAPLAVALQTVAEGEKFGINLKYCRKQDESSGKITITNYEMLHNFDPSEFDAVVLDESSILKSYTGKFRNMIIDSFRETPFRLACTATPAPNDFMELGNHAEFVGSMTRTEMLSMFFVHDGGETQKWRLKGHARQPFWKWICSWAVNLRKPSDLGYEDGDFILPPLEIHQQTVKKEQAPEGFLFPVEALTLQERQQERRATVNDRCTEAAKIAQQKDRVLIWCDRNDESATLKKMIPGAVEVKGSDKPEHKEWAMLAFARGEIKALISKPSICGFGMNFQICSDMIFVGLSDSYEQFYQAVRRCWRFGQKNTVNVHVVTAETEGAVVRNIERKETAAMQMADEMVKHMAEFTKQKITSTQRTMTDYHAPHRMIVPQWCQEEKCA